MRRRCTVETRVCARLPSSSHSLRSLVRAVCVDGAVPVASLHAMDEAVTPGLSAVEVWQLMLVTVGKAAMMRALQSLVVTCSTGPCTALAISDSHERVQQERRRADAQDTLEAFEARVQRARQEGLMAYVEGELTSRHEAGVAAHNTRSRG